MAILKRKPAGAARRGLRRRPSAQVIAIADARPSIPTPETVKARIEQPVEAAQLESKLKSLVDEHDLKQAELRRLVGENAPPGAVLAHEKRLGALYAEVADLTASITKTRAELARVAAPYRKLIGDALGELRRAHVAALEIEVEAITRRLAVLNQIERTIERAGSDAYWSIWRADLPQIAGRILRTLHPERG